MRFKRGWLLALLVLIGPVFTAHATSLPTNYYEWQMAAVSGPVTAMAYAPDGRLFVLEQSGAVRVIKDGAVLPEPFLSLGVNTSGERGLLGIAFDPDFAANQYVYLYFTMLGDPPHNRLARFSAAGNVADPNSGVALLDLPALDAFVHNGGALHFGPDGRLYVAVGENAVGENAQSLDTSLGKILRINPDGSIPDDNPFAAQTTGANAAIWARGLRNPFTFGFDPASGLMLINDVGADGWEEIDAGAAGANYGWPVTEGDFTQSAHPDFTRPVYAYPHNPGCAITGGVFYRPAVAQFPGDMLGQYFFADYCANWIKVYDPVGRTVRSFESETAGEIVDLDVSPDGSLAYLSRTDNAVHVIQYSLTPLPVFAEQPQSQTVSTGWTAGFRCRTSDPVASTQWQRAGGGEFADIDGETSGTLTLADVALKDSGARFRCIATNANGSTISAVATLTVVDNQPPAAAITQPAEGATYRAGTTIAYAGTGIDPEDGALPPSALTWQVDFHHFNLTPTDAHTHPVVPATSGSAAGMFTIPTVGEVSPHVWYRITLTVTDSSGLTAQTYRDVYPVTSTMTFLTDPPGLSILLDGEPRQTPLAVVGVAGVMRSRGAILAQHAGGWTWRFTGWTSGGVPITNGTFATPDRAATFVAHFSPGP